MRNGRVNRLIGETGKIVMSVNRIKTIIETFLGSDMPGEVQQRFAEWLRDPASRDEKERALENYWNGLRAEEPGGRERKLERLHEAMRRGERFRVRRIWRNVAAAAAVVLLAAGWRWQARWNVRQDWKRILGLSAVVCALTQALYIVTARWYGPENSIHIEVLLPAFVIGMLMKHREIDTPTERRAATGISFLFMLLVGMSMPLVTGASAADAASSVPLATAFPLRERAVCAAGTGPAMIAASPSTRLWAVMVRAAKRAAAPRKGSRWLCPASP